MSPGFKPRLPRLVWAEVVVVLSLARRGETEEERRRQTLCDKRENNFDWKKHSSKLNPPLNRTFWKRPENINLSEETTKHASNSPVTFVTNKRFGVLLRKLTFFFPPILPDVLVETTFCTAWLWWLAPPFFYWASVSWWVEVSGRPYRKEASSNISMKDSTTGWSHSVDSSSHF